MATARFTREEVLDKIFSEIDDENSEVESEDGRELEIEAQKERLNRLIGSFNGGEGFNSSFFRELTLDVLMPIVRLSSSIRNGFSDDQREKGTILLAYVTLKELIFILNLLKKTMSRIHIVPSVSCITFV